MPESKTIVLDPITQKEFNDIVTEEFNKVVAGMDENEEFDSIQAVAELFFYNGFLKGCLAMTDKEELRETLLMMKKEIEYQKKNHKR